jgi:hypothetical protein
MSVFAFNDSLFCVIMIFPCIHFGVSVLYIQKFFPALKMLFILDIFYYVGFAEKTSKLEFRYAPLSAPLSASLTACNNSKTLELTSTKYYAVRVLTYFVGKVTL